LSHAPLLQGHFKALREGENDSFSQMFLVPSWEEGILVMKKACAQVSQIKQKNTVSERGSGDIWEIFWMLLLSGMSNLKVPNNGKLIT